MIMGLTGTLAAGKGTVVSFLIENGFRHYSVRQFLIQEINKRGLVANRDNMVLVANELREKHSPDFIVESIYEMTKKSPGDCVIESLRCPGEIEALRKKQDFYLLAVDADPKIRYERAFLRGSETDKISFEEFLENEKREMHSEDKNKQNLRKCISMADFVLENNENIEELKQKVEKVIGEIYNKDKKRKDYLSWDEYFMGVSILSSKRSKDPNTQVGACIINQDKKIIGIGYNGFPKGCSDETFPWGRIGEFLETKYPYVVHAELNAILNSVGRDLNGCTMYVALFPCNECAKAIIQSGIKRLVYLSDKYKDKDFTIAAKKMFDSAGVKYEKLSPENKEILLEFEED